MQTSFLILKVNCFILCQEYTKYLQWPQLIAAVLRLYLKSLIRIVCLSRMSNLTIEGGGVGVRSFYLDQEAIVCAHLDSLLL